MPVCESVHIPVHKINIHNIIFNAFFPCKGLICNMTITFLLYLITNGHHQEHSQAFIIMTSVEHVKVVYTDLLAAGLYAQRHSSLSLSHCHTHSLPLSLTHSLSLSHTHSLSPPLSLSLCSTRSGLFLPLFRCSLCSKPFMKERIRADYAQLWCHFHD